MNIRDVAALAGVSPATVSRFINDRRLVGQGTCDRIQKVLSATGYDVKSKSKRIDINHNPTIGVMIPSLLNPVFSEIVSGIQERARHFGFSTLIVDTRYDRERERQAVVDLIRQRVSGVILTVASVQNNEALALLHEFNFPLCLVHNESVGEVPSVYVDNVKAGWDVADFLITSGHHRLGMIAGQFHASDRAKQRYAGFQRRIQQDEVACLEVLIEVDPSHVTPFEQCDITATDTAPTAWFCSNDLLALKLINHFHLQGLSVPGDRSVIGFDGMSFGQLVNPPLATVKVPHRIMGNCAVDLLFNSQHETGLMLKRKLAYEPNFKGSVTRR